MTDSDPEIEIRRHADGSVSEVRKVGSGGWIHKNLTPGKGACTNCSGPLDADADMVTRTCTKCWDEMFQEE